MRPVLSVVLAAALAATTACDNGFRPETLVADLRVLGVRSTPADLAPGETAQLDSLIPDPSRPGKRSTTVWLGCEPDPFNQNRSACSDTSVLQDPANIGTGASDGGLPQGMTLIGLGPRAAYTAPATLFDVFPAGDARRVSGTVGQVLAFSIAEEVPLTATKEDLQALFTKVKNKEVKWIITLFRVHVSESPERNQNPAFSHLLVNDARWPDGAHLVVKEQEKLKLDVEVPDDAFEPYTNATPEGVEQKTERVLAAWFSTAGRYSEARTALREGVTTVFTGPGGKDDPVPDDRKGTVWVVLRDTRGGQSWREVPLVVCDPSLPAPVVTAVHAPATAGAPVSVEGEHLENAVDVLLGEQALVNGAVSTVSGRFEGLVPGGATGTLPVSVLSRACGRVETGLTLAVP